MSDVDVAALIRRLVSGAFQESLGRLVKSNPQLAAIVQLLTQREQQLRGELEQVQQEMREELLGRQEAQVLADLRARAEILHGQLEELTAAVYALCARLADAAETERDNRR